MKDVERTVHGIITLGKRIDKQQDATLQGKLLEKREILSRYLHTILLTLETKIHKKPTLDISSGYSFALQKYKLSCEIAALRMILNAITKESYTEEQIFRGLPIYAAPLSWNGIWGDPDKEFV
jgi:hypothetical protein